MKILIIGTGYVGLVSGACFSEVGHEVVCLDIDPKKIANLKEGILPIYEPGLSDLVLRNGSQGRLTFTTSYEEGIAFADICFLALPTPSQENGSCDTRYLDAAIDTIAPLLTRKILFVNKSTAPVGTAYRLQARLKEKTGKDLEVVSNPEFLKEGAAIQDCLKPDRVILGCESEWAKEIMQKIYAPFMLSRERLLIMDTLSSEMTKYASNAMLATRISFMNEIASICKRLGANVNEVRKGMGADHRIGYPFLYPGVGYGGSCFPKDVKALIAMAKDQEIPTPLLESVEGVNYEQKKLLSRSLKQYFKKRGGVKGKTIAVWGLSFKPDTDDMREAPSLKFIEDLLQQGAYLRLFDPVAMQTAQNVLGRHPQITWCASETQAADSADAIALLTEWKQFRLVDFSPIKKKMRHLALFDGRNQYQAQNMTMQGFDYICIGAPDQIIESS